MNIKAIDLTMTKIVVLDGYSANPGDLSWKELDALGDVAVYERTKPAEIIVRAADADIVLTNKVVLSKEIIAQLPKLRYVGVLATGYNVVDVNSKSTKFSYSNNHNFIKFLNDEDDVESIVFSHNFDD